MSEIEDTKAAIELLVDTKKILDSPDKWTKGAYARGKSGKDVSNFGRYATCFCLAGAFNRAAGQRSNRNMYSLAPGYAKASVAMNNRVWRGGHFSFVTYNDLPTTTYEDIIRLIDESIENLNARIEEVQNVAV